MVLLGIAPWKSEPFKQGDDNLKSFEKLIVFIAIYFKPYMKKEESNMKYRIGIAGKAGRSKQLSRELMNSAKETGREIAKANCLLVNGACMGVSFLSANGAVEEGGIVLGFSPANNLAEHIEPPISYPYPPEGMELIFTGEGKLGRNIRWVKESEAVICIGGSIGTLNEFSIATHEGKIIGILEGMESILEKINVDEEAKQKSDAVIIRDSDPKRLVKKIVSEIKKKRETEKPRGEIPITFRNDKENQLVGMIHLPYAKEREDKIVVITHGMGKQVADPQFVELSRNLASVDIPNFRFDFEGCGNSQGKLKDLIVKQETKDLKSAVNTVFKEGDFDPNGLILVGDSLGAVVNCLFTAEGNFPVKSIVLWSPAFNQEQLFKNWYSPEEIAKCKKEGIIVKGKRRIGIDYLEENIDSDYSNVLEKINIPVLIVHGNADEDVPLEYSKELAEKYSNVNLKVIPGADHKKESVREREELIKSTVEWIKSC